MRKSSECSRSARAAHELCPGSHGYCALRRLRRCGRRRLHGCLQLRKGLLNICFCRSKSISHHFHGLSDRFLHHRDLLFRCHRALLHEIRSLYRDVRSLSVNSCVRRKPIRSPDDHAQRSQHFGNTLAGSGGESNAQKGARGARDGQSAGSTQHSFMLAAMEDQVKRYSCQATVDMSSFFPRRPVRFR
jgi:hypothetical protein